MIPQDALDVVSMHLDFWQLCISSKTWGAPKYQARTVAYHDLSITCFAAVLFAGVGYYDINLLKEPFNMSQPLELIDEKSPDQKHMLLYDVQSMTWVDPLDGLV